MGIKEAKEPYGFIYITTNMVNGKRYIGQRKFNNYGGKRWETYLGSGVALNNAINKYGKENFHRDIVAIAYSKEELDKLEIEFIKLHNAVESRDYYNITRGGYCGIGREKGFKHSEDTCKKLSQIIQDKYKNGEMINPIPKGSKRPEMSGENHFNYEKHHSDETRKKISESHKGKIASEETRNKLREINKGENNPNYGNRWSEEQKKKASEYWKEHSLKGGLHPSSVKVINLDTMEIFQSISEAKEKYPKGDISACVRGKTQKACGYRWAYYNNQLQQVA